LIIGSPDPAISWIKSPRRAFDAYPDGAKEDAVEALALIADGGTPDIAKPLTGLGSGVWDLAIKERGDAFRVVYALQLDDDI